MNYFRQLRAFRIRKKLCQLAAPEIALWFALMNISNELGTYNRLSLSESTLCVEAGLSRSGLYRARNKLQQHGLIEWNSRKGSQAALYTVVELVLPYEAQTEAQCKAQTEAQCEAQSGTIYLRNTTEPTDDQKNAYFGWRTSARARAAIAQRLLDAWDAAQGVGVVETPGRDPHKLLCDYMQGGMAPEEIRRVLSECCDPWYLENRLYLRACGLGLDTDTGMIGNPDQLYFRRTEAQQA